MIKPMLATLTQEAFDDEGWVFEIKWDGYRALAHKTKKVELLSRNAQPFNKRFPLIVKELEQLPGSFILDGELVLLDKNNRSSFQLLQNYQDTGVGIVYYCVFDILFFQGKDLRRLSLIERKEILRRLLGKKKWKYLRFSEHIEKRGKQFFDKAKKKRWEGIIAKKKDSPYLSVRSRNWLKIKAKMRQEVVIGGFTAPRGSRSGFGSLLVGVYERGEFLCSGHVGTGFNEHLLKTLYQKMLRLKRQKCPFKNTPHPNAPVTWIQPTLVCEIAFAEWTKEGMMRQPVFQGLRTDKPPKQVHRE